MQLRFVRLHRGTDRLRDCLRGCKLGFQQLRVVRAHLPRNLSPLRIESLHCLSLGRNTGMSLTPSPLLGCAVADALGKPFETKPLNHPAINTWDGESYLPGDYPNLPKPYHDTGELLNRPGVPTDDTQMSRILARSITDGSVSVRDGYVEWLRGESFVGAPRGMGGTIRRTLVAHSKGEVPEDCDPTGPCGTGAAMRSGVLGMLDAPLHVIIAMASQDSAHTHPGHPEAKVTAAVMAAAVWYAKTHPLPMGFELYWDLSGFLFKEFNSQYPHSATVWSLRLVDRLVREAYHRRAVFHQEVLDFPDDGVGVTASAILVAAIAKNYKSGVGWAIRLGGDTDTRAAMVGTILGTRFGIGGPKGIPEKWVADLYEADTIKAEDAILNTPETWAHAPRRDLE